LGGPIQRACTDCEEEKQDTEVNSMVHRAAASDQVEAGPDLQQKLNSTKGSGTALPEGARSSFESALGADFSGVKIHTGTDAVQMNKALGAHAFTHGSDIYFNSGKFDPSSSAGKHLLAHELTHTIQQGSALRTKKESGAGGAGHLKTVGPSIQASWYNFDIPFTDYQFDPSLQGIKNAAGIVKDTAVAGVEWIVDEIKGLVSSAQEWLSDKWSSLKEFATSNFDAVKSAFTGILGFLQSPLAFIANAIVNFDADSLVAAWGGFTKMVSGVWEGFQAVTGKLLEQVSEIWEGINGYATSVFNSISNLTQNFLFKKLPDALQKLAHTLINQLKSLWQGIYEGWNRVFKQIKTWVDSALDTVLQFVNRIMSFAIDVVIEGIKQFGKLVLFLQDLFANPKKYLAILAEKSVAVFDGLETQFAGIVSQYFGDAKTEAAATPTQAIQLQPDPGAAPEAKSSASWGDIGTGVWELMGKKWNEFKSNPLSIVTTLLLDMFVPIYGTAQDIVHLFGAIKKILTGPLSAGSLEEFWTSLLLILDIPVLISHTVVSILMRHLMLPLIVASFIPHPVVKGIAAAVGYGLLGLFVQTELMNVGHKVVLLKTGALTQDQKTEAYNRIADTFIAFIMTGAIIVVMLLLHFIANVMKGIYSFVKGKVFPVEKPVPGGKGKPGEGKGKGGPEEGKTGEGKSAKDAPSQDGNRKLKMNEKGLCEVCASPCAEVRKKYGSVITPEIEAKLKAIEGDPALSDAQKLERLKPIEQELADLLKLKGKIIGDVSELTPEELKFVNEQVAQGKTVEIVKGAAGRTPDFIVDGQRLELKTISGVADATADGISKAIANRVMNGRGQATDIVVDARAQKGITQPIAERGIARAYGADNVTGGKITSIRVIGPDFDITVPRK
jgi:hypothetical protein